MSSHIQEKVADQSFRAFSLRNMLRLRHPSAAALGPIGSRSAPR